MLTMEEAMRQTGKLPFAAGSIVKGTVIEVGSKEVLVDIGYKSEGVIPGNEFEDIKTVKVGDFLNIPVADVTKVKTNNATVLKVSQPTDDGTVQMSGGAEVLAAGDARLVVITKDGKFVVKVTATDS